MGQEGPSTNGLSAVLKNTPNFGFIFNDITNSQTWQVFYFINHFYRDFYDCLAGGGLRFVG